MFKTIEKFIIVDDLINFKDRKIDKVIVYTKEELKEIEVLVGCDEGHYFKNYYNSFYDLPTYVELYISLKFVVLNHDTKETKIEEGTINEYIPFHAYKDNLDEYFI